MDKVKTIVINEGEMIQDTGVTKLTDEYVEVIPDNYIAKNLKVNIIFKNYRKENPPLVPMIKINNELCPMMVQKDFEIKYEDEFVIESLQINNDFYFGDISMILVNYNSKIK